MGETLPRDFGRYVLTELIGDWSLVGDFTLPEQALPSGYLLLLRLLGSWME